MEKNDKKITDYSSPVAYDAEGKPLYAHPSKSDEANIQSVHLVKSREPIPEKISDATRLKHQRSQKTFPELNLSDGEFVITNVKRHPIGLIIPTIIACFLIAFFLVLYVKFDALVGSILPKNSELSSSDILFPTMLMIGLILMSNYLIYYVYNKNQLFLTNESLIQHIRISIFTKKERVISLMDIEDISFTQTGIIQHIFNYGSIRLSTEGENSTYCFSFVPNPEKTAANLNNAIESFKYGRSVNQSSKD